MISLNTKDSWYSLPFFSGPEGCKLCLDVNANGFGDEKGTHVSVFVQIVKGEYDDKLT